MKTKKIEIFLGVVFTQIIVFALGVYMLREPWRLPVAQEEILTTQLDEAMTLYAENCALCHGAAGEGLGATPPLNNTALAEIPYDDLFKIIARGRYDTTMPAWSKEEGGSLSEYQISELVALIQYGDWQETAERTAALGLTPLEPFTAEPDPELLDVVAALPAGDVLAEGIRLYAEHCVACHGGDGLGTDIAPPLNAPDLQASSAEELSRIVNYGVAGTLMPGWSGQLTESEVNALVVLMQRWDEVPVGTIPQPDEPVPVTADSLAQGEALFAANCARCHGPEGQGTPRAPALNVQSFLTTTSDQAMMAIIANGVPGTIMPAWGDRMSESDLQALVGFIRQWEPTAPEVAVPVRPGGGRGGPPWLRGTAVPAAPTATPTLPAADGAQPPDATIPAAPTDNDLTPTATASSQPEATTNAIATPTAHGTAAPWTDWRVLALGTGTILLAFILLGLGYDRLKR